MLVTSQAAVLWQIGLWILLYQGWCRLKSLSTRCSLGASNRSRRSVTSVLQAVIQVPPRGWLYTLCIQRVSSSICSQREYRSRLENIIFQLPVYVLCQILAPSLRVYSHSLLSCSFFLFSIVSVVTSISLLSSWQATTTFLLQFLFRLLTSSLLLQAFQVEDLLPIVIMTLCCCLSGTGISVVLPCQARPFAMLVQLRQVARARLACCLVIMFLT